VGPSHHDMLHDMLWVEEMASRYGGGCKYTE